MISSKFIFILAISWIIVVSIAILKWNQNFDNIDNLNASKVIADNMQLLQKSKERYKKLQQKFIKQSKLKGKQIINPFYSPSLEYEVTRRRVEKNIVEMWYYLGNKLRQLLAQVAKQQSSISAIYRLTADYQRVLIFDFENLRHKDNYAEWRQREGEQLTQIVQDTIYYRQHPKDCQTAKPLLCRMDHICGFTCQLRLLLHCLLVAFREKRTLVLESRGWMQLNLGWEQIFQPVGSCSAADISNGNMTSIKYLSVFDSGVFYTLFRPHAVPQKLAKRLERWHGNPTIWWMGQFLKYLLRLQMELPLSFTTKLERPIVGIHVRRTDKLNNEAKYYKLKEYMECAEDYFQRYELNGSAITRRIFLATDDPQVIAEARAAYPHYQILYNANIVQVAGTISKRYTNIALYGVLRDLHLLSQCDFLVCTLSSGICRSAYEIMQVDSLNGDAFHNLKSLDNIYMCYDESHHYWQVIVPHMPHNSDEIELLHDDSVRVLRNNWNGYSKGFSKRINRTGVFPTFKVASTVESVDMPILE